MEETLSSLFGTIMDPLLPAELGVAAAQGAGLGATDTSTGSTTPTDAPSASSSTGPIDAMLNVLGISTTGSSGSGPSFSTWLEIGAVLAFLLLLVLLISDVKDIL